jgi:hypothetical protein
LYINATNVATSTDTDAMGTNSANLIIGARKQGLGHFFDGQIDNVMIFNRALSQVEIDALYSIMVGLEQRRSEPLLTAIVRSDNSTVYIILQCFHKDRPVKSKGVTSTRLCVKFVMFFLE